MLIHVLSKHDVCKKFGEHERTLSDVDNSSFLSARLQTSQVHHLSKRGLSPRVLNTRRVERIRDSYASHNFRESSQPVEY